MIKEIVNKFNSWNKIKQDIELKKRGEFFINPREIWNINIGQNIGFESFGKDFNFKRPVLVIKNIGSMFFIASMTTKGKNNKYYYKLNNKYFNKDSYITLSQIKTVDKKRFIKKIGMIDKEDYLNIKKELGNILL